MNWLSRFAVMLALGILAACGPKTAHQEARPDGDALVQFREAVDAYVALQRQQVTADATSDRKPPGAMTDAARQLIADRIRKAREGARQGDIFTPGVARVVRRALDDEVRGKQAAGTRAAIRDDAPRVFALAVNMDFPAGPLPTMPGNVLKVLPTLPDGLDFRIVQTNLILRDTVANLVVDYLPDVMCKTC